MKVYVLEDETNIMRYLLQILEDIPYLQVVGHAEGILKAAAEITLLKPELVLADIRLKDGNSFQLFDQIGTDNYQVVFLTAYDEYAIDALNMGALGYLLKPINEQALRSVLEKHLHRREPNMHEPELISIAKDYYLTQGSSANHRIALKGTEYIEIVTLEEIIYCKSDKSYTTFFLKDKREVVVSKGLKQYETMLANAGFIRCHQSYLVNFLYVKRYFREGFLELSSKEMIPVSIRKKEEVLNYLESMS